MNTKLLRRIVELAIVAMLLVVARTASAMPPSNSFRVVETNEKGWVVEVGPDTGFHILASTKLSVGRAFLEATGTSLTYKALDIPENYVQDKQGRKIRPRFIPTCKRRGDGFQASYDRDVELWNSCLKNGDEPGVALEAGESGRLLIKMEPVQTLNEIHKELGELHACQKSIECLNGKLKALGGVPISTEDVRKIQDDLTDAKGENASSQKTIDDLTAQNAALVGEADFVGAFNRHYGKAYLAGLAVLMGLTFVAGRRSTMKQAEAFKSKVIGDLPVQQRQLEDATAALDLKQREVKTLRNLEREKKTVDARVRELDLARTTLEQKLSDEARLSASLKERLEAAAGKEEALETMINSLLLANQSPSSAKKQAEELAGTARALELQKKGIEHRVTTLEREKGDLESDIVAIREQHKEERELLRGLSTGFEAFDAARFHFETAQNRGDPRIKEIRVKVDQQAMWLYGKMVDLFGTNESLARLLFKRLNTLITAQEADAETRHKTEPMTFGVASSTLDRIAAHQFPNSPSRVPPALPPDGTYSVVHGVDKQAAMQPAPIPQIADEASSDGEEALPSLRSDLPSLEQEDLRKTKVRRENPLTAQKPEPEVPFARVEHPRNGAAPLARFCTKDPSEQRPHTTTDIPPPSVSRPLTVPMAAFLKENEDGRIMTNPYGFTAAELRTGAAPPPYAPPRAPNYQSTPPPPPSAPPVQTSDEEPSADDRGYDPANQTHSTVVNIDDVKHGRHRRGRKANGDK
ncbi:MAG: hypothetical protein V1745_02015 [Patescibacteria group bacterium]